MGARQRIKRLTPYLLLAPGILWLLVFYVYPSIQMFISSFWTGTLETGFTFSLANWTTRSSICATIIWTSAFGY